MTRGRALTFGVLGKEPVLDQLLEPLPARDGEASSRWLHERDGVERELSLVSLGPTSALDDGPPTQLSRIDGLLVELADEDAARHLVILADHLASVTPQQRSRLPLRVRVPALSDPRAWLEQACADALPALEQKVIHVAIGPSSEPPTVALDALIDASGERDRATLDAWLTEHPKAYTKARRQIDDYLADHPDSPHRDALAAAIEARRTARVKSFGIVPAALAALAVLVAFIWVIFGWVRDGERLTHARAFEGESASQRWLAIDAYRGYVESANWASSSSRIGEARRRIAELTLDLLRDENAARPDELERHVALADRFATDQPGHPAVTEELPALRRALLRRIGTRDASVLLAPLEREGADLAALDDVSAALEARLGAPLPGPIAARLATLRADRARQRDRAADQAIWKRALDGAAAAADADGRIAAYQRYLTQRPTGKFVARARESILREQQARQSEAWSDVADIIASRARTTPDKIAAIDDYLRAHPSAPNVQQANALRIKLVTRLVTDDWKTTEAAIGKAPKAGLPEKMAALRAHLRRVADHATEAHVRTVRARINQLHTQLDDQTYIKLKQWFAGDPQASAKIDAGFAAYLKDFPAGRHRKAAEGFRSWWKELQKPRKYAIEIQSVRLNKGKLGRFNDRPDCYIVISSGKQVLKTPVSKGYAPTWKGQVFRCTWKPGQHFRVTVWDKDYRWDDKLFSIDLRGPVALALMRQRLRHKRGHAIQLRCTDLPWPELP